MDAQKNSRLLYQSDTTITSNWNVNLQGLDKPQSFRIFNSRMIVGLRMKTCHTLHGIWRAVLADKQQPHPPFTMTTSHTPQPKKQGANGPLRLLTNPRFFRGFVFLKPSQTTRNAR